MNLQPVGKPHHMIHLKSIVLVKFIDALVDYLTRNKYTPKRSLLVDRLTLWKESL